VGSFGFFSTGSNYNSFILDTGKQNTKTGFVFTSSIANKILSSTATVNGNYGYEFTSSALRNYLSSDRGTANKLIGFYDLSVGAGSLGTDNFYSNNFASTNGLQGSKPLMLGCPPIGVGPQC
jgi:hypothetical protein